MKFLLLLVLAMLTGCAGLHEAIHTERVTIPGKTVDQVRSSSVAFLITQGWTLKQSDALMLRFEKESPIAEQLVYNRAGAQATRDRLNITLLSAPSGVDLLGNLVVAYSGRGGSDQENSTDQSNARGRFVVSCVRASVLGEPIPKPPVSTNSAPVVTRGGHR